MSSIVRPRVRLKPPDKPLLHDDSGPWTVEPGDVILYLETLQAIVDLSREICRRMERDDQDPNSICRVSDLSWRIWSKVESLPLSTVRSMVVSVQAYKSILQSICTNLERDMMHAKVEKRLNAQVDLFLAEFEDKVSMAWSACWNSSAKPPLHGNTEQSSVEPDYAIPYFETLQEILDLTQEMGRWTDSEGNNGILKALRQISGRIWTEVESLPPSTARSMVISVQAYKSVLQSVLVHLEHNSMNANVEKRLKNQVDLISEDFKNKVALIRSVRNKPQSSNGSSSLFRNIQYLLITGGNFVSHTGDTSELQETCGKILQSVSMSSGNSVALRGDIARLQETSEKTLRAVHTIQTIVLFY